MWESERGLHFQGDRRDLDIRISISVAAVEQSTYIIILGGRGAERRAVGAFMMTCKKKSV